MFCRLVSSFPFWVCVIPGNGISRINFINSILRVFCVAVHSMLLCWRNQENVSYAKPASTTLHTEWSLRSRAPQASKEASAAGTECHPRAETFGVRYRVPDGIAQSELLGQFWLQFGNMSLSSASGCDVRCAAEWRSDYVTCGRAKFITIRACRRRRTQCFADYYLQRRRNREIMTMMFQQNFKYFSRAMQYYMYVVLIKTCILIRPRWTCLKAEVRVVFFAGNYFPYVFT